MLKILPDLLRRTLAKGTLPTLKALQDAGLPYQLGFRSKNNRSEPLQVPLELMDFVTSHCYG